MCGWVGLPLYVHGLGIAVMNILVDFDPEKKWQHVANQKAIDVSS